MKLSPESLARASSRHPWRTVGIWVVIFVAAIGATATILSDALTTDFDFTNNPEAKRAQQILEERGLEQDVTPQSIVMVGPEGAAQDPAFVAQVNAVLDELRGLPADAVLQVPSSYPLSEEEAGDPRVAALGPIPSDDGTAVLFTVIMSGDSDVTGTVAAELDAHPRATPRSTAPRPTCSAR